MLTNSSKALRLTLALLVGLPGTVVFGPVAGLLVFAGAQSVRDAIDGGPWNYSPPPEIGAGLISLAWGMAGLLGAGGFWVWVAQPSWLRSGLARTFLAGAITLGMLAMVPFTAAVFSPPAQSNLPLGALSAVGILVGALIIYLQFITRRTGGASSVGPTASSRVERLE